MPSELVHQELQTGWRSLHFAKCQANDWAGISLLCAGLSRRCTYIQSPPFFFVRKYHVLLRSLLIHPISTVLTVWICIFLFTVALAVDVRNFRPDWWSCYSQRTACCWCCCVSWRSSDWWSSLKPVANRKCFVGAKNRPIAVRIASFKYPLSNRRSRPSPSQTSCSNEAAGWMATWMTTSLILISHFRLLTRRQSRCLFLSGRPVDEGNSKMI